MNCNLLLDTTREHLMFALYDGKEQIFSFEETGDSHKYHSSILIPKIQDALLQHNLTPQNLGGLAVNWGPGSFTGIRTGLTVARLMGQFLPLKTYGFDTFSLIAGSNAFLNQPITIFLNAFRQQHYYAVLKVDEAAQITWLESPTVQNNATPLATHTEIVISEASLNEKIDFGEAQTAFLEELKLFTPQVMSYFLEKRADDFEHPWQEICPMYLQLPQITVAKAK